MEIIPDRVVKETLEHYEFQDGPFLKISPERRVRRISRPRNHFMLHPEANPDLLWEIMKETDPADRYVIEDFGSLLAHPKSLTFLTTLGHTTALRISNIDHSVTKITIGEQ